MKEFLGIYIYVGVLISLQINRAIQQLKTPARRKCSDGIVASFKRRDTAVNKKKKKKKNNETGMPNKLNGNRKNSFKLKMGIIYSNRII